jgi:hypothetical protein
MLLIRWMRYAVSLESALPSRAAATLDTEVICLGNMAYFEDHQVL